MMTEQPPIFGILIVAAGRGERAGQADGPKQYRPIGGAPPHWPPAADLRGDAGVLRGYAHWHQFRQLLRSGTRPDGSTADTAMPRNAHMNDTDIEAMFLYLKSIDIKPQG